MSAATAVVLLCGLFSGLSSAEASCGDYVLVHGHAVRHGVSHAMQNRMGAHADEMTHGDGGLRTEERSKVPCSGPLCSRTPDIPVIPVKPLDPVAQQWGIGGIGVALAGIPAQAVAFVDVPVSLSSHPRRIYHPPR